jgi:hypothetical protein
MLVSAHEPPSDPAPIPMTDAPPLRRTEEEPSALLEVFARIEAFAKVAEAGNTKPTPAEDERKPV